MINDVRSKNNGGYESFADRGGFDDIASCYDSEVLRYFYDGATELINELEICGTESILDLGTGTGHTSIQIAEKFPECKIVGIDISEEMLSKAKGKSKNLKNLQFQKADWENLQGIEGEFDIIVNSFGISFVKDFEKLVKSICSKLKENSKFAYVNFVDDGFMPYLLCMYEDLNEMNIKIRDDDLNPVNEILEVLMNKQGFKTKKVVKKKLCYTIKKPEDWWTIISKTAIREAFFYDSPIEKIEKFKELHLNNIKKMIDNGKDKITVPVVVYVLERKLLK